MDRPRRDRSLRRGHHRRPCRPAGHEAPRPARRGRVCTCVDGANRRARRHETERLRRGRQLRRLQQSRARPARTAEAGRWSGCRTPTDPSATRCSTTPRRGCRWPIATASTERHRCWCARPASGSERSPFGPCVHGPSGAGATSTRTVEPFQSSALTAEIHIPSSNLGCIGLLAPLRSVLIGTAAARLATQSVPFQYFGCRSNRLAGTRATNICDGGGDVGIRQVELIVRPPEQVAERRHRSRRPTPYTTVGRRGRRRREARARRTLPRRSARSTPQLGERMAAAPEPCSLTIST